ncbi:putative Cathepsin B [Blattamonas nauphoetae]|uniref:Cathepsin B n=1 Tax=Blattamonas nauphoetae TaxID=2049346 RepID=A0ABQ9YK64_9EUKA|nr:putative Cathepsin B [Blattamonas nauphoetae]
MIVVTSLVLFLTRQSFSSLLDQDKLLTWALNSKSHQYRSKIQEKHSQNLLSNDQELLAEYDSRKYHPSCKCLNTVLDQGQCGSCWAFSSAGSAADSLCVHEMKNIIPSPQYMVACTRGCLDSFLPLCANGCNGGTLPMAGLDIEKNGIIESECIPYTGKDDTKCYTNCTNVDSVVKPSFEHHKGLYAFIPSLYGGIEKEMMLAIMASGSITVGFTVFTNFKGYKEGVYNTTDNTLPLGGHAVRLVGWNQTNDPPYWIMVNSWGEKWGMNGTAHFLKGQNFCGIENQALFFMTKTPPNHKSSVHLSFLAYFGIILAFLLALTVLINVLVKTTFFIKPQAPGTFSTQFSRFAPNTVGNTPPDDTETHGTSLLDDFTQ